MRNKNVENVFDAVFGNGDSTPPSMQVFCDGTVDDFIADVYDPAMTLSDGTKVDGYDPEYIRWQMTTYSEAELQRVARAICFMLAFLDRELDDDEVYETYEIYVRDNGFDNVTVFSIENAIKFDCIDNMEELRHEVEGIFTPCCQLNMGNILIAIGLMMMYDYNHTGLRKIKTNLMTTDDLITSIAMANNYINNIR